nr:hypothetical protein [uncultured Roseibium sp.]
MRFGRNQVGQAFNIMPRLMRWVLSFGWVVGLVVFGPAAGHADWINLSGAETSPNIAEITVLDDRVRIALEIYVDDISKVPELLPQDWLEENATAPEPLRDRMKTFSEEKFQVVADGAQRLTAELRLSEPRLRNDRASPFAGMINPVTRQKTPEPPSDKRVLYVELDYLFEGKPATLSVIPPTDAEDRALLAIGFIAYHKSVPVIDFRYLTGPVTLKLDWDDPWYSVFDNPNLQRHHRWPMLSFLYIEPREVRHEIVVRLRDLDDWVNLDRGARWSVEPDGREEIKQKANHFFRSRNQVEIDGIAVDPRSVNSEFLDLSMTGVQVIDDEREIDPTTAVLGISLSYPVDHLPRTASTKWDLFSDRIQRLPATSIDPAGPFPSEVSITDPVHTWTNHLLRYDDPRVAAVPVSGDRTLRLPMLSLGLGVLAFGAGLFAVRTQGRRRKTAGIIAVVAIIGAALSKDEGQVTLANPVSGLPDPTEASDPMLAILANANAAFLEIDNFQLSVELSKFVHPDATGSVAAELERAIKIKITGGTTARVETIQDLSVSEILPLANERGFSGLVEWTARARGQHWGHTHLRDIAYRARADLIEQDGMWWLTGLTVLEMDITQ